MCTIGKLKEIPDDFPLETEEITIANQDIRVIPANGMRIYRMSREICCLYDVTDFLIMVHISQYIQSELLNWLYNKNTDETSVVSKGPLPRSILDVRPQSMRT